MIIVINAQGKVLAQQNEDLFQGSVKANVIDLVAPFATNVTMYASFELPDGTYYAEEEMRHSVKVIDGLNVWKQVLNFPVTKNYGIVTMQFRAVVGNQTICSGSAKIPIQKGVPYVRTDDLEQTQYDELKALISDVKALLANKVEVVSGKYEIANVNADTVGEYYIYQEESDSYLQAILPENYVEGETYYTLSSLGRVINDEKGLYLEFVEGENKTTLRLTNSGVTINDVQVVTVKTLEENLVADKVKYNSEFTKLGAENVQEAIDKLHYNLGEVENSQVIDIGEHTIKASDWADGSVYTYKFRHELFTNALMQALIITPNKEAIDNLNNNDILIYPEVDIEQESEGVAVAIIKAERKPEFDIVANIKIQGTTVNIKTEEIQANQIVFVPTNKISSKTVQSAIVEVQAHVDDFKASYDVEKANFVKLDVNGRVPSSQLPSYVDDVIECYLHNGAMYLTRTGTGIDVDPYVYSNPVTAVSGKIYIDLQTNKQYRWSGTQYAIISESLAIGEVENTAFSGARGVACETAIAWNMENILAIMDGTAKLHATYYADNATNSIVKEDGTYSGFTQGNDNILKADGVIVPKIEKLNITEPYVYQTNSYVFDSITSPINIGDIVEARLTVTYYGDDEQTTAITKHFIFNGHYDEYIVGDKTYKAMRFNGIQHYTNVDNFSIYFDQDINKWLVSLYTGSTASQKSISSGIKSLEIYKTIR